MNRNNEEIEKISDIVRNYSHIKKAKRREERGRNQKTEGQLRPECRSTGRMGHRCR